MEIGIEIGTGLSSVNAGDESQDSFYDRVQVVGDEEEEDTSEDEDLSEGEEEE